MAKWIDEERYAKIKDLFVYHYDTFYYIENNIARLINEYREQKYLIVYIDYESIIEKDESIDVGNAISIIAECQKIIKLKVIIGTSNDNSFEVIKRCKEVGIDDIEAFNSNIYSDNFYNKKIFANICFNDRAHLYGTLILFRSFIATMLNVKDKKYNYRYSAKQQFKDIDNEELKIPYYIEEKN